MQSGGGRGRIDVDAVIRRSRGRRRTKELLIGGATTLALLGFVVPATLGVLGPGMTTAGGSAESADAPATDEAVEPFSVKDADGDDDTSRDLDGVTGSGEVCADGAPAVSLGPQSHEGLELSLDFPASASADADTIVGTGTLTNTSDVPIEDAGTNRYPWITLSRDGVVIWQTTGMRSSRTSVTLEPGESMEFSAEIEPIRCDPSVEPERLISVAPGEYDVSGRLTVDLDGDPGSPADIVSRSVPITLE